MQSSEEMNDVSLEEKGEEEWMLLWDWREVKACREIEQ
jgi:hypothetical protein